MSAKLLCPHFSVSVRLRPVYGHYVPLRLPEYHCAHCLYTMEPLSEGEPHLRYGPDTRLVSKDTCTQQRFERDCQPALPASKSPLHAFDGVNGNNIARDGAGW